VGIGAIGMKESFPESISVVLMQKNPDTGFLETELDTYPIKNDRYITQIFAAGEPPLVHMCLTTDPAVDLTDEEFEAVYDLYEPDRLLGEVENFSEIEGGLNPVWEVVFPWNDNRDAMAEKMDRILTLHLAELAAIFSARKN
jgi:hypothetical protein